jgi:hypothetical protein
MAISDNYVPVRQIGNGVTVNFSAGWYMLASSYARVYLEDAVTGVQTLVAQGPAANQYTLVFNASGFTVTFNTAPTSAYYVVIGREVSQDQTDPYSTSKGFQGETLEASLDKLTAICQDTSENIGRALTVPLGDTATSLVFPPVASRALMYAAFDAAGNVTATPGTTATTPISAAMAPVVAAATTTLARNNMDASQLTGSRSIVTPATNDYVGIADTSASGAEAKVLISALLALATSVIPFSKIAGFLPTGLTGTATTGACTITAGQASDSSNSSILAGGSFSWAVSNGNAANGYQGGTTLPNGDTIHLFAIATAADTTWSACFASNSVTPTLPGSYTKYRRIGSFTTTGSGAPIPYLALESSGGGIRCLLTGMTAQTISVTTSDALYALNGIPTDIRVRPILSTGLQASTNCIMYTDGVTSAAPAVNGVAPGVNAFNGGSQTPTSPELVTNTSAQIRARASGADSLYIYAYGWEDFRR